MELTIFENILLKPNSEVFSDPIDVFYFDAMSVIINYFIEEDLDDRFIVDIYNHENGEFVQYYRIGKDRTDEKEINDTKSTEKGVKKPKTRIGAYIGLLGTDKIRIKLINRDPKRDIELINLILIF